MATDPLMSIIYYMAMEYEYQLTPNRLLTVKRTTQYSATIFVNLGQYIVE